MSGKIYRKKGNVQRLFLQKIAETWTTHFVLPALSKSECFAYIGVCVSVHVCVRVGGCCGVMCHRDASARERISKTASLHLEKLINKNVGLHSARVRVRPEDQARRRKHRTESCVQLVAREAGRYCLR